MPVWELTWSFHSSNLQLKWRKYKYHSSFAGFRYAVFLFCFLFLPPNKRSPFTHSSYQLAWIVSPLMALSEVLWSLLPSAVVIKDVSWQVPCYTHWYIWFSSLTSGHERLLFIKWTRTGIQASEINYLCWVIMLGKRDKVRSLKLSFLSFASNKFVELVQVFD